MIMVLQDLTHYTCEIHKIINCYKVLSKKYDRSYANMCKPTNQRTIHLRISSSQSPNVPSQIRTTSDHRDISFNRWTFKGVTYFQYLRRKFSLTKNHVVFPSSDKTYPSRNKRQNLLSRCLTFQTNYLALRVVEK